MLQSPRGARAQMPPSLSPRDLALSPASSRGSSRRLSQQQMLEMAFEGESQAPLRRDLRDSGVDADIELSPRSSSSRNAAHDARRSFHDSDRSWHELSTVLAPTTPSHAMVHGGAAFMDDDTADLEQDDPELFRQGVMEHAARLGIDPRTRPDLMWIARESLVAQLPEGWVLQHATSTSSPYYYHVDTGVSQWDHPMDEKFRRLVEDYKRGYTYAGGSDHLSASEGMHTASFYEQNRGYGDGTVAAAWENDYDAAGGRLSYDSADYQQQNGWRNEPALDLAAEYYQGYEAQTASATGSSSKGYEDYSDLDVADSRSTLIASGPQSYARGSGAASPSLAELEALKIQVQELEQRNKELEEQNRELAQSRDSAPALRVELEALQSHVQALETSKKELEDHRSQDDELILKLESQMKILMEQAEQQQIMSDSKHLDEKGKLDEKENLEAEVNNLREALAAANDQANELKSMNEAMQKNLETRQQNRSEVEAADDEKKLDAARERDEVRRELAEEVSSRGKLEEDLASHREQAAKISTDLNDARAVIKKLEGDLLRSAKRAQDEDRDIAATKNALTAAEDQNLVLNAQLNEVRDRLRSTEAELAASQDEITTTKRELSRALDESKAEYQTQVDALTCEVEAKVKEINARDDALRIAAEEKRELEHKLEQQIQHAAMAKAEADDQQRTLKRDIRVLERDLKALQSVSKEREAELTAAKRVIADLEQKLGEQNAIVEAAKRSAREEAEKAAGEIIQQVQAEKTRVAELYTQELQTRRKLHNRLMELQGNIRVFCRVRPIQAVELKSEQSAPAVYFRDNDPESLDLVVGGELGSDGKLLNGAGQKHQFEFDHIFQPDSSQNQVFEQTKALVTSALDGFNVCIFAYGQTGSGKTHTMEGSETDPGIYYRSLVELFKIREERTAVGDFECSMKLSMLEVYNETIVDLLDNASPTGGLDQRKGLEARLGKQGVYVDNLIEVEVYNEKDVTDLMQLGKSHRSVGAHDFNEHSSRSHLVLSIAIETFQKSDNKRRYSKLHLIDLAGSERVSKTAASGQRLKEAQNINRSLSALGDVIAALGTNSKHVPYRNSKLTFLLQDSLSGNSKVLMFVNVSPVQWNAPETLCSLNFASRCRNVALGMAKASGSSGSDTTSSASPSSSKEPSRNINTINTASGPKQRPAVPSPSVKGAQRVVYG